MTSIYLHQNNSLVLHVEGSDDFFSISKMTFLSRNGEGDHHTSESGTILSKADRQDNIADNASHNLDYEQKSRVAAYLTVQRDTYS